MITIETYPKHGQHVLKRHMEGTLVLLDLKGGQYYSLNEVGGLVWDLCDGSHNIAEIVATVCQQFDAPADEVELDVRELLEELANEKLVVLGV